VSKNNTGSLPLRGILPVKTKKKQTPHFLSNNSVTCDVNHMKFEILT